MRSVNSRSLALPLLTSPLIMTILEALRGSMKRFTDSKKALNTIGGCTTYKGGGRYKGGREEGVRSPGT